MSEGFKMEVYEITKQIFVGLTVTIVSAIIISLMNSGDE